MRGKASFTGARWGRLWLDIAVAAALFGLLYAARLYSYNLFHSIAELFSVVVGFAIFIIAWNTRSFARNSYLLVLGVGALFIGLVDCLHMLSYKGMGVFTGTDANLPTQLWLIGRFLQTATLILAALLLGRRLEAGRLAVWFAVATAVLLALVFAWPVFPAAFVEGQGLTLFKKVSEYVIAAGMLYSLAVLYRKKSFFAPNVFRWLAASTLIFVVGELAFTLYSDVYGLFNLLGHFLRIVAICLVYKAVVETSLTRPYESLFRDVRQSEEAYRELYEQQRNVAAELQRLMLSIPKSVPGLRFGHVYRSAAVEANVGGDFYDVFRIDDSRIGILIGDVSGHGLAAAATAFLTREMARAYTVDVKLPSGVMERAGRGLVDRVERGIFVTAFLAVLDPASGELEFCSAGHPPALLKRRSGQIVSLGSPNLPLGVRAGQAYADGHELMREGDILFLYTDGLIEARCNGSFFGEARVQELLAGLESAGVEGFPGFAVDQARKFAEDRLQDDIAVVCLCRAPSTAADR